MISNDHLLNQDSIQKIKNERVPVIIFGAAIVGEVLFHACVDEGIKVECFCDNNLNKTKRHLCDLKIFHTADLKSKYRNAVFIISVADIKDVVDQLQVLGFSKWYTASHLLNNFDVCERQFSAPPDFVEYAVNTCILCHDSFVAPDRLFLRSVDIIITERCSLKCKDCSNLMQYYKSPKDCNTRELLKSINLFSNFVDEVNEFRVIGGEPFMNKDVHLIIKRLVDEPKVKKIVVYTNGTIIPKKEKVECLKHHKVMLIITDYGSLSKNLEELIQVLSNNQIAFYRQEVPGWTDCAKIMKHRRNIDQQKEIFKKCCAKNTATISNGKLFRCPFVANADRLHAIPAFEGDSVNLLVDSIKTIDIDEMKKKIKKYLLEKDFLQACDYCNGRSFGDPVIIPSVQIKDPLAYELCC